MQGDLFVEATQTFSSWVYQSVRIFNNLPIVEFEFTVGPIPIKYAPVHNIHFVYWYSTHTVMSCDVAGII